jgi:hypothetical protein
MIALIGSLPVAELAGVSQNLGGSPDVAEGVDDDDLAGRPDDQDRVGQVVADGHIGLVGEAGRQVGPGVRIGLGVIDLPRLEPVAVPLQERIDRRPADGRGGGAEREDQRQDVQTHEGFLRGHGVSSLKRFQVVLGYCSGEERAMAVPAALSWGRGFSEGGKSRVFARVSRGSAGASGPC